MQHKDLTTARQGKYMADSCELLEFLQSRNPFSDNYSLNHCDMNQCWHQCKRRHRKIYRRQWRSKKCCNTASRKKTKLSHSAPQLSKSTMKQYRSIHNCCFKGSSQQELGMTSWKRCSNSNFAAIPQQSSKPDML